MPHKVEGLSEIYETCIEFFLTLCIFMYQGFYQKHSITSSFTFTEANLFITV